MSGRMLLGALARDGVVQQAAAATAAEQVESPVAGVQSAKPHALRVPSVLRCGLMIFAAKLVLRRRGFGWTIRWLRHRVGTIPADTIADVEVVKAAERAVAMAAALYPGRAMCLEQSVVLYYLLRRQGIAVRYCQGVHPHPFAAHAWVEYRGEPINDVSEHVKWFARLPEILP